MKPDSVVALQCEAVAQTVQQLRNTFRASSYRKNAELTDHFWALQDHLHRLVTMLYDDPAKLHGVSQQYPQLSSEVLDILGFTSKTTVGSLPAIDYSCRAIYSLLFELQNLKQSSTMAASV